MIGIPAPTQICGYCHGHYTGSLCECEATQAVHAARATERERHQLAQRAGIAALASIPHLKRGDRT